MEITKFIFEILGALGAVGTFGAFIMLFIKDKYKQDQIDKLTNITEKLTDITNTLEVQNDNLAQQLRVSVLPELWTNGTIQDANGINFRINIGNRGEIAKLLEFNLTSEDVILVNNYLPYDLLNGDDNNIWIFLQSKGKKKHKDCDYKLEIVYADKLNNKYILIIEPTKKGFPTIVENKEV